MKYKIINISQHAFQSELEMKKPTLCCFTWIAFVELNFKAAFLLIQKAWDDLFAGNIMCISPFPFCRGKGGSC